MSTVQAALAASKDVVLGPASDGGYVLLGMKRLWPGLFTGKAWGESSVFADTLASCHELGLDVGLLPELVDIDRPEDLVDVPPQLLKGV